MKLECCTSALLLVIPERVSPQRRPVVRTAAAGHAEPSQAIPTPNTHGFTWSSGQRASSGGALTQRAQTRGNREHSEQELLRPPRFSRFCVCCCSNTNATTRFESVWDPNRLCVRPLIGSWSAPIGASADSSAVGAATAEKAFSSCAFREFTCAHHDARRTFGFGFRIWHVRSDGPDAASQQLSAARSHGRLRW